MAVREVSLFLALAGCGRIDFDALRGDGGISGDGSMPDGGNVGATCAIDTDCGACLRCRVGTCEAEPINRVFLGHQSTCFIGAEGSRWCTGYGNGVVTDPGTGFPVRREGEDSWTTLAVGFGFGFGLRGTELWRWNDSGAPTLDSAGDWPQLSSEDQGLCRRDSTGAVDCGGAVSGTWAWVDRGFNKSCAIDTTGALYCWGSDDSNALGQGVEPDATVISAPVRVGSDSTWTSVAVGKGVGCALKIDRTLWCWGRSDSTGTNNVDTLGVPNMISPDTDWASLDVHWYHACARKLDGRYFCWGHGDAHEVIPGMVDVFVPMEMPGAWDELVLGGHHYCGRIGADWSCWGLNSVGQLGVGGTNSRAAPTPLCAR